MPIGLDASELTSGGAADDTAVIARVGKAGRLRIRLSPKLSRLHGRESGGPRLSFLEVCDSQGKLCSVHSYSGGAFWRQVVGQLSQSAG